MVFVSWLVHIGKYTENSNGNEGEGPCGAAYFFDVMVRDVPPEQATGCYLQPRRLVFAWHARFSFPWPALSQQEKHFTVPGFLNCVAAPHPWVPFPAGLQPRKESFSITFPSTRFFCLFRMIVTVLDRLLNYWSPSVFWPHKEVVHGVEILIAVIFGLT